MNYEFTKPDLKKFSLAFRDISSRLIRSDMDEVDDNLKRFLNHIHASPILQNYLLELKSKVFDIEEGVLKRQHYDLLPVPTETDDENAYIYQLMILLNSKPDYFHRVTHGYGRGNKMQDHVDGFLRRVFQPFINNINSRFAGMMIDLGDDEKSSVTINVSDSSYVNIANGQSKAVLSANNHLNVTIEGLGTEIIKKLQTETNLDSEHFEDLKASIEYLIRESKQKSPNRRIGSRVYEEMKSLVETANLTIQTTDLFQIFMPLVVELFFKNQ